MIKGNLRKMLSLQAEPIEYQLPLSDHRVKLNDFLNQKIKFNFTGVINCIQCGRLIKKSFSQGFCFPCNQRLGECDFCNIHPERCKVEQGRCDANDWAHAHCVQPHIVYLANASALKVGVTRHNQMPTRWIDQGAAQALPIFDVVNRHQAGLIEVTLKAYVADKTNWRTMLKQTPPSLDLCVERDRLLMEGKAELQKTIAPFSASVSLMADANVVELHYPVDHYPEKIKSLSFDKTPLIEGVLQGVKGQYVLLDNGVLNIRKFGGYEVEFG